jgi:ElaB/YqjD/DUF883 family membrane-anchored ribosome-binding protein
MANGVTKMTHTYDNNKQIIKRELRHMMEHAEALMDATAGEFDERITTARTLLQDRLDSDKDDYNKLEDNASDKAQ